jgi:two-component system, cell cycle sensor histidine kinase and response regulator CckA
VHIVLVVDDEPDICDALKAMLERAGYGVLTARDGYEAIRLLAEHPIDVLLTDVRMPGLSGVQLCQRAKAMRAKLPVVFMTGYAGAQELSRHGHVLAKPIRKAALTAIIEHEIAAA